MKAVDSAVLSFLFLWASIVFCIVMVATAAVELSELSKKQSAKVKEPVICQCQCQCIDKE